jgi:hypothetical protein
LGIVETVTKTLILSHETACRLLEAHASMAAWYYQLTDALRAAGGQAEPPDGEKLKAFIEQLASHFPELAEAARSIDQPRPYIPPPVFAAPAVPPPAPADAVAPPAAPLDTNQPATPAPPPPVAPAQVPDVVTTPAEPPAADGASSHVGQAGGGDDPVAPPPMVDPKKVRYD